MGTAAFLAGFLGIFAWARSPHRAARASAFTTPAADSARGRTAEELA
jgi:hypothetical protein